MNCGDGIARADNSCAVPADSVVAKTAAYTVTVGDTGKTFTNTGAGASVTFTLPAPKIGLRYRFLMTAAQNIVVQMPTGVKIAGGTAGKAWNNVSSEADKATCEITSLDGTNYHVVSFVGTWVVNNT